MVNPLFPLPFTSQMNALLVKDEALRLEALAYYEILNSASDPVLDDIAALAAQVCNAPVAAISLLGVDRIWLKSHIGLDIAELSLGTTPCETTILGDTVYELRDARHDPDFAPDGILIGGHIYRFYAGAPLTTPSGISIGALFILDGPPRTLTPAQTNALSVLSRQVITRLELNARIRQIDRSARARQRVHEMRADETGPAGDEKPRHPQRSPARANATPIAFSRARAASAELPPSGKGIATARQASSITVTAKPSRIPSSAVHATQKSAARPARNRCRTPIAARQPASPVGVVRSFSKNPE